MKIVIRKTSLRHGPEMGSRVALRRRDLDAGLLRVRLGDPGDFQHREKQNLEHPVAPSGDGQGTIAVSRCTQPRLPRRRSIGPDGLIGRIEIARLGSFRDGGGRNQPTHPPARGRAHRRARGCPGQPAMSESPRHRDTFFRPLAKHPARRHRSRSPRPGRLPLPRRVDQSGEPRRRRRAEFGWNRDPDSGHLLSVLLRGRGAEADLSFGRNALSDKVGRSGAPPTH